MIARRSTTVRRSHQARRVLAWGVSLFLGSQLLLGLLLTWWLPGLGDPEYACKLAALRERLSAAPGRPLVLALGSSRAALGVRPEVVAESADGPLLFNFALLGSGPVMELCCLRHLLADGVRPAAVLVEFWLPFWNQEGSFSEEHRFHASRLRPDDLPLLAAHSPDPRALYRRWWWSRLVPVRGCRHVWLNRLAPAWLPLTERFDESWKALDEWGWWNSPHLAESDPQRRQKSLANARQYYAPILEQFRLSPLADRAFRELLELCRREGIAATVVHFPEASEFRSWYPPAVRSTADRYLEAIRTTYSIPVIDARDWAADAALADGFHLLPEPAAAFTRWLAQEVLPATAVAARTPNASRP
jgi:hypothetical protein